MAIFIVDNSVSGWTGLRYLKEWTGIAKAFDIATGYFEIGALLALDGKWQGLDRIRILMGAETSHRTRKALLLRAMPRRDFHPPVAGLLVDREGYLWVSEWSASEVGGPDQWSVFSPEGRWLAVLPAPGLEVPCHWYLNPCRMGSDFFFAVRRDALGQERVEGYRIRRHD